MWDVAIMLLNEMEVDRIAPTHPMLGSALHSCIQADVSHHHTCRAMTMLGLSWSASSRKGGLLLPLLSSR
jgi:hypothetical protein